VSVVTKKACVVIFWEGWSAWKFGHQDWSMLAGAGLCYHEGVRVLIFSVGLKTDAAKPASESPDDLFELRRQGTQGAIWFD